MARGLRLLLICALLACVATAVFAQEDDILDRAVETRPRLRKRVATPIPSESVRGNGDDTDEGGAADDDDSRVSDPAAEDELDGPAASKPLRHHRTPVDDEDNDEDDEGGRRAGLPVSRSRVVDDGEHGAYGGAEKTHFVSAFLSSLSVIIVSEIGDKTFFIAAILAMKHPRLQIFSAAISALALMTVLSAGLGNVAPKILSPTVTFWLATALFFFFGGKLLHQAYLMPPGQTSDEIGEVEEQLEKVEHDEANGDPELGGARRQNLQDKAHRVLRRWFAPVFLQCFTMTFVAEWGDRSQIATIALAAAKDVYGVTLGGILGHSICTGGAVLVGKAAASRISERAVSLLGGACFLICGLYSVYTGPDTDTAPAA